jgi:F-type H+-transporting ATPase subunit epsilon
MADTFELEIVTPEKMLVKDAAESLQLPGKNGYLGILPGHAPLITELAVGQMSYVAAGTTHRFSVAWGFAEVLPEKVTVLAEIAERADEIDVDRAREAKARAEKRLASTDPDVDVPRAQAALDRAMSRLACVEAEGTASSLSHS